MNKLYKHNNEWKKPDTIEYIFYDSLYNKQNYCMLVEDRIVATLDSKRGR